MIRTGNSLTAHSIAKHSANFPIDSPQISSFCFDFGLIYSSMKRNKSSSETNLLVKFFVAGLALWYRASISEKSLISIISISNYDEDMKYRNLQKGCSGVQFPKNPDFCPDCMKNPKYPNWASPSSKEMFLVSMVNNDCLFGYVLFLVTRKGNPFNY